MLKSSPTVPCYVDKLIADASPASVCRSLSTPTKPSSAWTWSASFLCACSLPGIPANIPHPGDYFTFEVGSDSLILLRKDDGQIEALFNTCRHRGSRLCTQSSGHVGKIVCPYHQWAYDGDGRLIGARDMDSDLTDPSTLFIVLMCA